MRDHSTFLPQHILVLVAAVCLLQRLLHPRDNLARGRRGERGTSRRPTEGAAGSVYGFGSSMAAAVRQKLGGRRVTLPARHAPHERSVVPACIWSTCGGSPHRMHLSATLVNRETCFSFPTLINSERKSCCWHESCGIVALMTLSQPCNRTEIRQLVVENCLVPTSPHVTSSSSGSTSPAQQAHAPALCLLQLPPLLRQLRPHGCNPHPRPRAGVQQRSGLSLAVCCLLLRLAQIPREHERTGQSE